MTTFFEIIVANESGRYARQAARAAFDEIDRLEGCLSRFIESSDVSRINALGAQGPVRVGLDTFECLRIAARVYRETNGAFDVTCIRGGTDKVVFDETEFTVGLTAADVSIDLGGIGKGFALDKAAETLRDWSIETALIHSGESSVLALGPPAGEAGWKVQVGGGADQPEQMTVRDRALSASGTSVKGRHIIDPRTGLPAAGAIRTWASCPSAAASDALSTAFMVMSPAEVDRYCRDHPDTWAMLLMEDADGTRRLTRFGAR